MDPPQATRTSPMQHFLLFTWKLLIFAFALLNLWALFGDSALPPDGGYFHLWAIFIAAHFGAKIALLCKLPSLVGMLVAGFIYGNVLEIELDQHLTSILRSLALMVILLRAGLALDPDIIRKLSFVCIRLSIIPSLIEAISIGSSAYYLFDLSISWSLLLGFVIASVSPAIVVPQMIRFQEGKLGTEKGIPTLIIAAASIDNVFAITGFSVCLTFAFSNDSTNQESVQKSAQDTWNLVLSILQGPFEALIGVLYGLVVGFCLWYFPERCNPYPRVISPKYDLHRFLALFLTGTFALFGAQKLDLGGSGPLAILVLSFMASLRWRPFGYVTFNEACLKNLWLVLENYLFCLIASDVRLKTLQQEVLVYGIFCIFIGIVLRMVTAYVVSYGIGLSCRERIFTAIAWLPKASVQEAIGSIALDSALTEQDRVNGRLVLTMAVLSILITAPLGAIAIECCARPMLSDETHDELDDEDKALIEVF